MRRREKQRNGPDRPFRVRLLFFVVVVVVVVVGCKMKIVTEPANGIRVPGGPVFARP